MDLLFKETVFKYIEIVTLTKKRSSSLEKVFVYFHLFSSLSVKPLKSWTTSCIDDFLTNEIPCWIDLEAFSNLL